MMIGKPSPRRTLQVAPSEEAAAEINSALSNRALAGSASGVEALTELQCLSPCNIPDRVSCWDVLGPDSPVDAYTSDHFRMYEFKVKPCGRGRSHDWTECPYAHPGEKARRRDPQKYHYSGTACSDFRRGGCKMGDSCEFAHGVFECWLHPSRYRTQPCKDGSGCRRRVCFFAHSLEQLRSSPDPEGSFDACSLLKTLPSPFSSLNSISPPASLSPQSISPPMSPTIPRLSRAIGSSSLNEMMASLKNLAVSEVKCTPTSLSSGGWYYPSGCVSSLPATPTQPVWGYSEIWKKEYERVVSRRRVRAKMFEKVSKEKSVDCMEDRCDDSDEVPDLNWVSELIK